MPVRNPKTGIVKSDHDKVQPYRVWYRGYIIWFARTQEEAEGRLELEQRRNHDAIQIQ